MTHDELLTRLLVTDKTNMTTEVIKWQLALYAVVQWHKPRNYKAGNWCIGCNADYEYPCPTIQAIESHL